MIRVFLVCVSLQLTFAAIYSPCEFAAELLKIGAEISELADWVCIAKYESSFNTSVIGSLNTDGSLDMGIFQINNNFWCRDDKNGGNCWTTCSKFLDENLKDDFTCARKIKRNTAFYQGGSGYQAWVAWTRYCTSDFSKQELLKGCALHRPPLAEYFSVVEVPLFIRTIAYRERLVLPPLMPYRSFYAESGEHSSSEEDDRRWRADRCRREE